MINCKVFSRVYSATPPSPAVARILTHSLNLAFGPKSGFKYIRQTLAGLVISGFKIRRVH